MTSHQGGRPSKLPLDAGELAVVEGILVKRTGSRNGWGTAAARISELRGAGRAASVEKRRELTVSARWVRRQYQLARDSQLARFGVYQPGKTSSRAKPLLASKAYPAGRVVPLVVDSENRTSNRGPSRDWDGA